MFSLYCSRARVLKIQRGAYKLVKQCRTPGSPTLSYMGGFPFYSSRWGPHYRYLALCLGTVGVRIVLVSRWGPLGRSGVGRLDPSDLLGQGMILAIFLGNASPRCCHILAQSGRRDHSGGRSEVASGLVRRSLRPLSAGPSRVAPVTRTTCPVRGVLPRSGWGRPVTLAGVMKWCAEATIITARGGSVCGCPLPLCRGARASGAVPLSGSPAG